MFVHASRIEKQFDHLESLGINIAPLLKQTGISREEDLKPSQRLDFELYKSVLDFALRQTGNPEYGLEFGQQPQLGGTIGMMSASCANMKEALVKGCEFLKLQGDFAEMHFMDDTRYPKLRYTPLESWALESPQTAKLEVDAMFSFLNTILKVNSNAALKPRQLNLACPEPENPAKYYDVFGVNPHFEAAANEMVFDNTTLMIPMKAYNPETFQLLNQYLQSQLNKLSQEETLSDRVKQILHSSFKYQFPDIDSVAEKLSLSARTLQRRLSEEQTTFKDIMQETRFGIAKQLLKQKHLSISEISYMLGYSDLGNFSRSFKKFAGVSPQVFKEDG